MNLQESIKKILREESKNTGLQDKLLHIIKTKGFKRASKVVGGIENFKQIFNIESIVDLLHLLNFSKEFDLYNFMKETGLNYGDIYNKVGELPREVKIKYLKDAVNDLQQTPGELDLTYRIGAIPLYENDDWQVVYTGFITNDDNGLGVQVYTIDDVYDEADYKTIRESDLDYETLHILVSELSEKIQHNRKKIWE